MKSLTIVGVLIFAVGANSASSDARLTLFNQYEAEFGKNYASSSERMERFNIFQQNLERVERHNGNPMATYKMGINKFSDMTDAEMISFYTGGIPSGTGNSKRSKSQVDLSDLPKSVDWREKGALTPVKNQEHCGSCWAFAATANIESYYKINTNELEVLSTQQLTSCVKNDYKCGGTGGCNGATGQLAYNYALLYGMVKESDMPYTSGVNGTDGECEVPLDKRVAFMRGHETILSNDMGAIMEHLANEGPLSISVYVNPGFHSYESGVYDGCSYEENIDLNHLVQLVGYGTDETEGDYWLVRNSWGPEWGEEGFIRLKRESTVMCGKDTTPEHGNGCENDGIKEQRVCGMCGILSDAAYPIGVMKTNEIEPMPTTTTSTTTTPSGSSRSEFSIVTSILVLCMARIFQ